MRSSTRCHLFRVFMIVLCSFAVLTASSSTGPLVVGVDAGTQSLRVGVFDLHGRIVAQTSAAYETRSENSKCDLLSVKDISLFDNHHLSSLPKDPALPLNCKY